MSELTKAASIAEIEKLVRKYYAPKMQSASGNQFIIVPEGLRLESVKKYIDEYRTQPERRKGKAVLKTLESFITHTNRFKDADSVIFANADREAPGLLSVLDYHPAGSASQPRFGEHRAEYTFPLSDQWLAWQSKEGEKMGQKEFVEFLEDRITDVISPDGVQHDEKLAAFSELMGGAFASPTRLVELGKGMAVREGQQVKQAFNQSTGEATIQYISTHQDENGAPLQVPSLFLIAVPVFKSGALYQVAVRLRYRIAGGSIVWFYNLYRADKVFDHAFEEAVAEVGKATELPVMVGQPE